MKERYRLSLRRKSVYDAFDHTPKTFQSLKTKDEAEAERLLVALNEAGKQPAMNLSLPGFKGVLNFVVTLTTHKDVRSYPWVRCRGLMSQRWGRSRQQRWSGLSGARVCGCWKTRAWGGLRRTCLWRVSRHCWPS